ncbi:tetratricopeptide repeat protein [Desulfovibrio inopinatus]|uniref:tetratricopeptide repeat protein n=1 Tax=Desulfovibrio inopinatus TaxID=102109 RepID=UPI0004120470|nr:tetratricopeptide repeat protein [Desulfovibrio inopinatus]
MSTKKPTSGPASHTDGGFLNAVAEETHEELHPLLTALGRNWKQLAFGITLLLAVVIGRSIYLNHVDSVATQANQDLQTILTDKSGSDLITALNDFAKTAPDSVKPSIYLETAKAAQDSGDFAAAQAAWKNLASVADSDIKPLALLGEADAMAHQKQFSEAVTVLEALQKSAPKAMEPVVASRLATVAEQAGNYEMALASYEKMKTIANMPLMEFIDFKIEQLKSRTETPDNAKEAASS